MVELEKLGFFWMPVVMVVPYINFTLSREVNVEEVIEFFKKKTASVITVAVF